jgi:hypothetical protein|tara:strand:+ start:874 stop:1488 length:615 start_codon:yes stop_codon:yes gene_type:complete
MYNIHAKAVQDYSRLSSDNLSDVILMVVLSIQQPWYAVGDQLKDVKKLGRDSRFIWGNKIKTFDSLQSKKDFIYSQYLAVLNSSKSDDDRALSLMNVFLQIDGLGLAKAGFVCQLTAGLVGCIDVHNIRMYNIPQKDLAFSKSIKSKALKDKKISNYISVCHTIGTESLWDTWCCSLATKTKRFEDGFHVSKVHYDFLQDAVNI